MSCRVEVRPGVFAQVDEQDLPVLLGRRWYVQRRRTASGREYRYLASKIGRALLHRVLLGAPCGMVVDHIDGDGLNNTRANLRICTHAENMRNRRPNHGRELPKGVRVRKASFSAEIRAGAVRRRKCGFRTAEEASRCYAEWAAELHGEYARV